MIINSRWDDQGASSPELTRVLAQLTEAGTSVFVADDGPTFSFHAEECQYDRIVGPDPRCEESSTQFEARYAVYRPVLETQVTAAPGTSLLETSTGFCNNGRCSMTQGDVLMFADHGHLNEVGSERVIGHLLEADETFRTALRNNS